MEKLVIKLKVFAAVAAGLVAFGVRADSSRLITVTAYNRGEDGVVESVDLAFGDCAEDYKGDLFVAYGYTAGSATTPTNGWDHYEKLSDSITAEVTTYHYEMPEGWSDSIYNLRFFLFTTVEGKEYATVKDYYVQNGLVKMFDGVDNVGTGAHDANARAWVDLAGNGYDISVWLYIGTQLDGWTMNSLAAKVCQCVPLAKSYENYVTIEIFVKYNGACCRPRPRRFTRSAA